jgi:DNA-binding NtrC family response regulator
MVRLLHKAGHMQLDETEYPAASTAPDRERDAARGTVRPKVLIVDDDTDLLSALGQLLESEGYQVATAATAEDALERFREETYHVVLTDLQLPGRNGIALVKALHDASPATRCVLITGHGSIRSAVLALKRGAAEYVTKPIKPKRLLALLQSLTADIPDYLPNKLMSGDKADVVRLNGMAAKSRVMKQVFERVHMAAAADTTVLITGEAGTGKELVARAIHAGSARAQGPFVAVHIGAIPAENLSTELFGQEKSASVSGGGPERGKIEMADGGTLFLDEVTAMDERMQLALLRFLETQSVTRNGSRKEKAVDVRLIAATSRDLQALVQSGNFREDLFYRLNVFSLQTPPLRERSEDIAIMAADFLNELASKYHKPVTSIPAETEKLLTAYPWPGNVRELRNVIEQGVLLARGDDLSPSLLPQMMHREPAPAEVLQIPIGTTMDAIEREVILRTLEANKGNKTATAEVLGISRRSIYNKLAEYEAQGLLPKSNSH